MEEVNIFDNLADLDFSNKVPIPYIIRNAVLISPGTWNDFFYSSDSIKNAFKNTKWDDKKILSLFLDHLDDRTSEWVGYISRPHMVGDKLIGDLEIFDINTAIKLALGKPKFGISPRVKGKAEEGIMKEFYFENFSFVINPAVKTTYINNMEVSGMDFNLQDEDASEPTELLAKKPEEEKKKEAEMKKDKKEEKPKEEELKKKEEYPYEKPEKCEEKDDLSEYTQFIKKYIKGHEGATITEAAAAWKKQHEEVKMAEENTKFLESLNVVIEHLKKYKEKYPYEYPAGKKMSTELEAKDKTIKELNERVEKLESKLNEPDKVAIKSETASITLTEYTDEGMMGYIHNLQDVTEV